ncbi:MAG: prolyl-tRNA synthetase associated domain-containing protein [Elioraea sp.]|nr:prolyl-tRNA synthetase associated domain-containing protein [Elioraea sp.]
MPVTPADFLAELDAWGIAHETIWHEPVFSVAETKALGLAERLPGAHVKNLFLKDKAGAFWLVTMLEHRNVSVNALARALAAPRMSFASAEELRATLGVEPGAVTPFALVNETARGVSFVLDSALLDGRFARISAHPLTNRATTAISTEGFRAFLARIGRVPRLVDLDSLDRAA